MCWGDWTIPGCIDISFTETGYEWFNGRSEETKVVFRIRYSWWTAGQIFTGAVDPASQGSSSHCFHCRFFPEVILFLNMIDVLSLSCTNFGHLFSRWAQKGQRTGTWSFNVKTLASDTYVVISHSVFLHIICSTWWHWRGWYITVFAREWRSYLYRFSVSNT